MAGSSSVSCSLSGVCTCNTGYSGDKCDTCQSGYFNQTGSGSNCTGNIFASKYIESSLKWLRKCQLSMYFSALLQS